MDTRSYPPSKFHGALHFAGSCRQNPGRGSIGFLIYSDLDGATLERFNTYVNDRFRICNTSAHYKALIVGLQHALRLGITHITAIGNCDVVLNQVMGTWTVKKPWLNRYYGRVRSLASQFRSFKLQYTHRKYNLTARVLAEQGFDRSLIVWSNNAKDEMLRRCNDPENANNYVMEQSCDGYNKIKEILDMIQYHLPESYAAIQEMCLDLSKETGG